MLQFLGSNVCTIFVKADVHRAVRKAKGNILMMKIYSDSDNDNADFTNEFHFDDGGPDYEWSAISIEYPNGLGIKWLEETSPSSEETHLPLRLSDVSISTLNKDQKSAYNLVMNTLSDYLECTDNCENFRMSVARLAGSGKSFLM